MHKICILKGGNSSEREVSLISALGCKEALESVGYACFDFDFSGDMDELRDVISSKKPSCVFNALHGGIGENGVVQAVLNSMKVPYTHSGVLASEIGMDKKKSRELFHRSGLRIPKGEVVIFEEFINNPTIPIPFVIKPVNGGSSNGVFIIKDQSQLKNIDWHYDDEALVETYISGLELTVGVMDDKPLEVTNILVKAGFYDYHNKYQQGGSCHELPAKIPLDIRNEAMSTAIKAHELLGCRGVSRSDFRYNDQTNELYILEINTQPGMTPLSLLPEQANYLGISYNQLVQWMVERACYDI